jgi:hypothetical protein
MTKAATIFAPSVERLDIALLVLPRALRSSKVASVLDPMRNANRHLGREGFGGAWSLRTARRCR